LLFTRKLLMLEHILGPTETAVHEHITRDGLTKRFDVYIWYVSHNTVKRTLAASLASKVRQFR